MPFHPLMPALVIARDPRAELADAAADFVIREQGEEAIADATAVSAALRPLASELDA